MTTSHYRFHYDDIRNAWVNGPPEDRLYGTYIPPRPIFAKVVRPGGVTFGGHQWPLATLDGPGDWVELTPGGRLEWGGPGLYSATLGYLTSAIQHTAPTMDGPDDFPRTAVELWKLEYDGPFAIGADGKVIGRRARIVEKIGSLTHGQIAELAIRAAEMALAHAEAEIDADDREIIRKIFVAARNVTAGRSRGVALERYETAAWTRARRARKDERWLANSALRSVIAAGGFRPLAADYWLALAADWAALTATDAQGSRSAGLRLRNTLGRDIMTAAGFPEFCHPGVPCNVGSNIGSTEDI